MTGASTISRPEVTIAIEGANQSVSNTDQLVLLVGVMDNANGTAVPGNLAENVPIDFASIDALFGPKSPVASAARAFRKVNQVTQLDVIPLDPVVGANAAGLVTFTGTATEDGEITVVVGSEDDHSYTLTISSGDTATVIGDALEAAITADARSQVSANNTAGAVALTAVFDGLEGNDIPLRVIGGAGQVAGVTAVVTTAMSSGSGDPSSAATFDVVANQRYQTVVFPGAWDVSVLTGFLDPRFNVTNDVLDGVGIVTQTDTLANLLSANNALNSQSLVTLNFNTVAETDFRGSSMLEFELNVSAQFAGARSARLTEGALISELLVGQQALDARGGPALASRPYFNTPFPNLPLIGIDKGWSEVEIGQLVAAGGSTIGVNKTRTLAIAGTIVTTYKTDAASNPDTSFDFLNKVDTASNAREFIFNNLKSDFSQFRLTTGSLVPGRPMANSQLIRGTLMSYYRTLSGPDYVLTQAGAIAEATFSENMTISLDLNTGLVTVVFDKVPLVSQFREFFGTFRVSFDV